MRVYPNDAAESATEAPQTKPPFRDRAYLEVRDHGVRLPGWLAVGGLLVVLLSWLRGVGSASGLYFLEPFIFANIPAFRG
jgi:hypothetical protein